MLSMALIPRGVAAPPMPSIFAEIFMLTYCLVSSDRFFLPNIKLTSGDNSLENFFDSPVCSSIEKIPIHIAYMAHSSKESLTARFEADVSPAKTPLGSTNISAIILSDNNMSQTLFMVKTML